MHQLRLETILLFDSECILCNSSIRFILKNEKNNNIKFCALKSDFGKSIVKEIYKDQPAPNSLIFINKNKIYTKSDAVLQICKFLKALFPLLYFFILIPKFLRDPIYGWIAKNRYSYFGKSTECYIPDIENKKRFIS